MKDFLVITTILCVVFGGNFFIRKYLDSTGKEFLKKIGNLEQTISERNSIKNEQISNILDMWEKNEKRWIMIGYHQEINEIEDLLIECYSRYMQGNKAEFDISYRKLQRHVEDMKNREGITFANIL